MAGAGFLQLLWKKPTWAFGLTWIHWIVCVCEQPPWTVPRKHLPHGELFFFLIQKEPATMLGSETFSPFLEADIRTPFFC